MMAAMARNVVAVAGSRSLNDLAVDSDLDGCLLTAVINVEQEGSPRNRRWYPGRDAMAHAASLLDDLADGGEKADFVPGW